MMPLLLLWTCQMENILEHLGAIAARVAKGCESSKLQVGFTFLREMRNVSQSPYAHSTLGIIHYHMLIQFTAFINHFISLTGSYSSYSKV